MKVRALRGVCIGVERHLAPGDTADLEPAQVTFLVSIKAVEVVRDEPAAAVDLAGEVLPAAALEPKSKQSSPDKSVGTKEK